LLDPVWKDAHEVAIVQLGGFCEDASVVAARVIVVRTQLVKKFVLAFVAPLQPKNEAEIGPQSVLALAGGHSLFS